MTLPLAYLYDEWLAAGLPVIVGNPHWQTYGRPYTFDVRGSIAHHTASPLSSSAAANRHVVINGNSVAQGPIAHGLLQRELVLEVIAAGRCNHGGAGWWPLGKDTANMYGFAIEAVNNGVGEYWQSEFVEIMARAYAVVHMHEGVDVTMAWTHNAYATPPGRKIDPAGPAAFRNNRPGTWTNNEWQSLVHHYMTPEPPPPPKGKKMLKLITYFHGRNYPPAPHWGNGAPVATTLLLDGGFISHVWSGRVKAQYLAAAIPEEAWFPGRDDDHQGRNSAVLAELLHSCSKLNRSPFDGSQEHQNDAALNTAWQS